MTDIVQDKSCTALILNSGVGRRMGPLTDAQPKCMTEIESVYGKDETIISRQLYLLQKAGIRDVVVTTGPFTDDLSAYCNARFPDLKFTFIHNPLYDKTNYIYSLYLARKFLEGNILFLHGDLVFEETVLDMLFSQHDSCMTVSRTQPLPEKDFKAVLVQTESGERIDKVGVEFFDSAVAAQPLYKLSSDDWSIWMERITAFCERQQTDCYAEAAFNEVSGRCHVTPLDIGNLLCSEIDTEEDLASVNARIRELANRTVYVCFSTDIVHGGHINVVDRASKLGRVIAGVMSDEAVTSYKRYPLLSFEERKRIIGHIKGVDMVVEQNQLGYGDNISQYKPDFVVHGDDWRTGFQQPIRTEVISLLGKYGGQLIEYPYQTNNAYSALDKHSRAQLSIPDIRRGRLRKLLALKKTITAIEAHSGITGLIAENTKVLQEGKTFQFDAMWVSSLCDSTAKGKPDIELVDFTSRLRTIDDIMEVTTKPIILDGDTGGLIEHFIYTVKTLERMGVSAVIIEDKTGLKKNSLFGAEVEQTQDSIESFSAKIKAGKKAQKTKEFMIIARIESLILERGMDDALERADAFVGAGADGIMIHSRKKDPDEIFEFTEKFRALHPAVPLVVVPTSFNTVTEEEFKARGVNIIIYANQLTRSGFPAMQKAARLILENHRAKEADDICMSIQEILTLIPEED